MTLSVNKPKLYNIASEIWKSAEWLRGKFKALGMLDVYWLLEKQPEKILEGLEQ